MSTAEAELVAVEAFCQCSGSLAVAGWSDQELEMESLKP